MARLITESMWRLGTVIRIPFVSVVQRAEVKVEYNSVTKMSEVIVYVVEHPYPSYSSELHYDEERPRHVYKKLA